MTSRSTGQRTRWGLIVAAVLALAAGCGESTSPPQTTGIKFADVEESNTQEVSDLRELTFTDENQQPVRLGDLQGDRNLVVVFTRGASSSGICLYCTAQTSRWVQRYDELRALNAELVVVFPIRNTDEAIQLEALKASIGTEIQKARMTIPYPIVFDLDMAMVERMGITGNLSKPATYIVDTNGQVRFAYVGESMSDRPSVDSVIDQLAKL